VHPGTSATLTREFKSGTKVIFTYSNQTDPEGKAIGTGEVWWGGVKPKPPPPPPAPSMIQCGSCGSSTVPDATFAGGEVAHKVTATPVECCKFCAQTDPKCTQWAWHAEAQGASYPAHTCHLHDKSATEKAKAGIVRGVMNRTLA
jgi:hypothetical protein